MMTVESQNAQAVLGISVWYLNIYSRRCWKFGLMDLKLQQKVLEPHLACLKNTSLPVSILPVVQGSVGSVVFMTAELGRQQSA